jgi:hypothetical protein
MVQTVERFLRWAVAPFLRDPARIAKHKRATERDLRQRGYSQGAAKAIVSRRYQRNNPSRRTF